MRKLLVANRGEIAIRIFRSCREIDVSTVAVYSEIDRDALHVSYADESYLLGETAPAASYLNIGKILEVAKRSGADAVHPGYGFLAENPRFAEAVTDAGLIWVGPPAHAIAVMGDKTAARRTATEAGVESVPGTPEPISGPEEIEGFASQHGWPVALKAAHGGGGRGFRVVRDAGEAAQSFEGAAREAQTAFGSPEMYLERYLEHPRHVEVQILGDQHGNLIHLGERDCSLQRRHQKLVEESPSPAVDETLRERMGAAAVKVAAAAGYRSAGTVEFLLELTDSGPRFWFLEVNTRLQVEHPVTEMVTGLDLVKQMIRLAEGEPLGFAQEDVAFRGHAIECRINAENPAKSFLPSPGVIAGYREPAGPGVRVDSGVVAGSEIPQAYDSLFGKLICQGEDREEAIRRTLRALDEFSIEGLRTTLPFHRLALGSDWFREGRFDTKTVENDLDLKSLDVPGPVRAGREASQERVTTVELDGKRFEARFAEKADREQVRLKPAPPSLAPRAAQAGMGETISAPMQGTIVKTLVKEGDPVKAGDGIVVLEAMKMENLIVCHRDGLVKELKVKSGDSVSMAALLAVIGPPEGG
ncbi:MAG: acetyl-CoA carboxylase biotin carboxylase subunit [Actinomycetota bacterium]